MYQLDLSTPQKIKSTARRYDFEEAKDGEVYLYLTLYDKPYGIGPVEYNTLEQSINKFIKNGFKCKVLKELDAKLTYINMCRSQEFGKLRKTNTIGKQ